MEEEEEKKKAEDEKKKEIEASAGAGEGDKSETPQSIVDANAAAKRLEEANEKHAELLAKQEDMIARKILGGHSEAGQEAKKEDPSEKMAEEIVNAFK